MIERLSKYIVYKGVSISSFESSIGASDGMIRRAINKKTDIQSKWLCSISENYHDLNLIWLITGKGDMLTDQAQQEIEPKEVIIYRNDPHTLELIDIQRKHIKMLEEQMTLCPARLDLDAPSTQSTPIPSLAEPKRAKNQPKPH